MTGKELLWRVYYGGAATYDSSMGGPDTAPVFGALVIVEADPTENGRRLVTNGDYYCWISNEHRWRAVDIAGLWDYLQQDGWKRVLIGRMVSNAEWNEVMRRANTDPDFPARTAWGFYERKVTEAESEGNAR